MASCSGISFEGYIAWPYLDFGSLGSEKEMEGLDLIITGACTVSIGYDQRDLDAATEPYEVDGDTLPGIGMIPLPVTAPSLQVRLTFNGNQFWEWSALNLYLVEGPP